MNLDRAKLITLLLTAGLLIIATLVKADENVKSFWGKPGQTVNHPVTPLY